MRRPAHSRSSGTLAPVAGECSEISIQFSRFAPYYDRFMRRYVDYPAWVRYVMRIFERYKRHPKLILDLACGTGIPTVLLADHGFRVIGVDRSEAMLEVLRSKTGDRDIRTIHSDIRDFTLPELADAAICLYDSVNYLLTPDDIFRCFQSVYRNLKPAGVFVFDMNTLYGLATFWGDRTTVRDVEDIHSIWESRFDEDTRVSTLRLTFYVRNRAGRNIAGPWVEIHEERGYTIEEVDAALRQAGFRQNDFFQHGTFLPTGINTSRMMVVAQK